MVKTIASHQKKDFGQNKGTNDLVFKKKKGKINEHKYSNVKMYKRRLDR